MLVLLMHQNKTKIVMNPEEAVILIPYFTSALLNLQNGPYSGCSRFSEPRRALSIKNGTHASQAFTYLRIIRTPTERTY